MKRTLMLPALVLVAGAALAGCTSTDEAPDARSTPKATNSMVATAPAPELEQATVPCENGEATVADQNNKEVTVPSCDTVIVSSSNAKIALGDVKHLRVAGAINGITAGSVDDVSITGDGNQITTSSDPDLHDSGKKNVVHGSAH